MKMKNGEQKDLGCDGKGKRTILVKVKKFRAPAKMFVQCSGCAKCQSHLVKYAPDGRKNGDSSLPDVVKSESNLPA